MRLETIDHAQVAIPAGGEDKARPFYAGLLGLPEQPKPPELAKRGGCWFESDRVKVHCGVETPFAPARKAHIAFRVDDVQALAAQRAYRRLRRWSTTTCSRATSASTSTIPSATGWSSSSLLEAGR